MLNKKSNRKLNPANILIFMLKEERRSSTLLLIAAVAALYLANSTWSHDYFDFFTHTFRLGLVSLSIRHWINEGLMALFFLVVSLEVKRELIDGELKTWRKASFPIFAAIGGMFLPALIFTALNPYQPQSNGWGIPMATDIAIALGVLALLGKRVPKSLRVFLLSLAIVDDVGSILIIGLFYNHPSNMFALFLAAILSFGLVASRKNKYWPVWFLFLGLGVWYAMLIAGVSATMAGVIVAFLMPLTTRAKKVFNLQASEVIEDVLIPVTTFVVVPLFVFANAGLDLSQISLASNGGLSVFLGTSLGLLIGKPLGILCASWIATKLNLSSKPANISWSSVAGIGFIAGIGFTVSLLISDLSYRTQPLLLSSAVFGIFTASILGAIVGLAILKSTLKKVSKARA
ncbi:Na+/H+ antiporter NhaA [soil metagenome]